MTTETESDAVSAQPIGTPPGGGRWAWHVIAARWVQLPDHDEIAEPDAATAAKEE